MYIISGNIYVCIYSSIGVIAIVILGGGGGRRRGGVIVGVVVVAAAVISRKTVMIIKPIKKQMINKYGNDNDKPMKRG